MKKSGLCFPETKIAFCDKHLESFREKWPSGYGILVTEVLSHVLNDIRFASRFSENKEGKKIFDAKLVTKLLVEFSPLCCFLGDDLMGSITAKALRKLC